MARKPRVRIAASITRRFVEWASGWAAKNLLTESTGRASRCLAVRASCLSAARNSDLTVPDCHSSAAPRPRAASFTADQQVRTLPGRRVSISHARYVQTTSRLSGHNGTPAAVHQASNALTEPSYVRRVDGSSEAAVHFATSGCRACPSSFTVRRCCRRPTPRRSATLGCGVGSTLLTCPRRMRRFPVPGKGLSGLCGAG
jgi:hypothetical protein